MPFGIPSEPPRRVEGAGPRARFPGIGEDAQIVLWNGGIWNWLDPVTAVAATVKAAERSPRVRLVFMFARGSATARSSGRRARRATLARARSARSTGWCSSTRSVISYDERATWLLEADCILSTHLDHLESNFSFRTRLLDCFWAGVPAVCTGGDELSELIERCDGGVSVPYGDVDAVADGIVDGARAAAARPTASACSRPARSCVWPRAVEPLRRIVQLPGPPRALGDPWARRLSRPRAARPGGGDPPRSPRSRG